MAKNRQKFPRILTGSDFGLTSDVTLVASQWSEVGRYTVGAQQQATFGIGGLGNTDSREPLYIRLDDTSGQLDGVIRLSIANATQTREEVVVEQRTERLSASTNDRTKAVLLGEYPKKAGEDSLLLVKMKVDGSSDKTLDYDATETKMLVPATLYQ